MLSIYSVLDINKKTNDTDSDILVENVKLYTKSRLIEVYLRSNSIIHNDHLDSFADTFKKKYGIDNAELIVKYEGVKLTNKNINSIAPRLISRLRRQTAIIACVLQDSIWRLNNDILEIGLLHSGLHIVNEHNCDRKLEAIIYEKFNRHLKVVFKELEQDKSYKDILEKEKLQTVETLPIKPSEAQAEQYTAVDTAGALENTNIEITDVIKGKAIKDPPINIVNVYEKKGHVVIQGDIFKVENRELKSGKFLISFALTDYTGSINVKLFAGARDDEQNEVRKQKHKERAQKLIDSIKVGKRVILSGKVEYDEFSKETVIFGSSISEIALEQRMDNAEKKRVELHLHTQMSTMDAVSGVKDLVKRAIKWGHSAIAITDHGVVQAFPDAFDAARKSNTKIIYGVECYLQCEEARIVYNTHQNRLLNDEFVVFDIETTGLSAQNDRITEIGAVKIKDFNIIDRFNTFVNPGIPIPAKITELTGITDDMVKDAPDPAEAVEKFYEFAGDAVLVAHNATFDTGFIRVCANAINKPFEFCYLDTVELCRCLFPSLKRHRLDSMVKHLGIELHNHHRAVDDAEATAEVFKRCLDMLKDKEITELNQINIALARVEGSGRADYYHAILLVKNRTGLENLYRIISKSHMNHYYKRPMVPRGLIKEHREGLLVGSACEMGELYRAYLYGMPDEDIQKISDFYDYFEIQPLGNNAFLVRDGKVANEEGLKAINKRIIELGKKNNKLTVAACDVHFLDPQDEIFRRVLMAGQGFNDADNQAPLYLRTTEEMLNEFDYLGEDLAYEVVVENTNAIADMIDKIQLLPDEPHPPKIDGVDDEIVKLSNERAVSLYGSPIPELVKSRMDRELESIIKHGFSVMYIIAQKLVWKSLEDGYLVGSRGSVGSSFIAFLTGITEVNALQPHYVCPNCRYSEFITDGSVGSGADMEDKQCPKCGALYNKDGHDIPFETFLGFDGDKEPDIDLNFSGEYQPNAHKYTEVLFGKGYVFRAGTISTLADKTAYGFVKKYIDERNLKVSSAEIERLTLGCAGAKKTTGQHPGGIMVVPRDEDIHYYCPIQHPADDKESGVITTHFDYHSISGRLLKLDILGHDDPTVIRMLEDLTSTNARDIKIGDKKTMSIFTSTEAIGVEPKDINSTVGTFGVPEFGTGFVRKMLMDTKPTTFAELVRISGLSHGTDVWLNNAQAIIQAGNATLSEVICTRDDIMTYLIYQGLPKKDAFKIMEDVRKGKGLKPEYIELMQQNNVPDWYIESCKKIKYMFPKAHAVAYVMMAFRIAYYKVHYPKEFYATYFTVRADEFDAGLMTGGKDKVLNNIAAYEAKENPSQKEKNVLTILEMCNEMYARGIVFLNIDLYKSDAFKFKPVENGILPPLNALPGLGRAAAENMVAARQEGEFHTVYELRERTKISKAVIDILRENHCLEGIPETDQLSLF